MALGSGNASRTTSGRVTRRHYRFDDGKFPSPEKKRLATRNGLVMRQDLLAYNASICVITAWICWSRSTSSAFKSFTCVL
jgi:hypothetical protein